MSARGRLLEVVDGIPVYAKADPEADALALRPGRRGRLERGGPVYEVDRLGSGAAYVHKVYDPPQERPIGPWPELGDAAEILLRAIRNGTPDQAFAAGKHAAGVARQCRRIIVYRGPAEPGISLSARFVERV